MMLAINMLGVSEADVMAEIEGGTLPAKKIGSSYRVTRAALDAFLLTEGTPAEVVDFFKMMRDAPLEGKVSVELKTPTPEQAAQFNQAMEMPDGKYYKLPITPSHQLVISSGTKEGESSSTSSSSFPVAQKDGKFVIPLPVPTGQAAK